MAKKVRRPGAQTPKHQKELKAVRQRISRMEKRGYRFSEEFKKELYSYSTQKLKGLSTKKLYTKYATALDPERGTIISGKKKREAERRAAAAKAAETRARRKVHLQEGRVIWAQIENLINAHDSKGAEYLKKEFEYEIKTYGRDNVIRALGSTDQDMLKVAQDIIYYERPSNEMNRAFIDLHHIIKGYEANEKIAKKIGRVLDQVGYEDEAV